VFKDELAGWFKDMNKYRAGSDLEFWLSSWNGQAISLNRKSSKSAFVDKPFIPVIGGIQPDIFERFATGENKENGFVDRMLISYPELNVERYNNNVLNEDLISWYEAYLMDFKNVMFKGFFNTDERGEIIPMVVTMSEECRAEWIRIHDKISDMQNSDVIVVTAGVPRKPGQTREELVSINASIVKTICEDVKRYAPDSILIIVSNPLDAMLTVAKAVTQFPRERVIGMSGVLDSSRFRANIALKLGVHLSDVSAIVLGAHTDKDMVPIVSTATVGGIPLSQLLSESEIQAIVERTKRGGAELTELIGTSAWVAPGAGVTAMVESILLDQNRILPCSVDLSGEFGISDGCLCVPVTLNQKGAVKVHEFTLSQAESNAMKAAYQAYLEVKKIALSSISNA
jgi:malate dehydrogenase